MNTEIETGRNKEGVRKGKKKLSLKNWIAIKFQEIPKAKSHKNQHASNEFIPAKIIFRNNDFK